MQFSLHNDARYSDARRLHARFLAPSPQMPLDGSRVACCTKGGVQVGRLFRLPTGFNFVSRYSSVIQLYFERRRKWARGNRVCLVFFLPTRMMLPPMHRKLPFRADIQVALLPARRLLAVLQEFTAEEGMTRKIRANLVTLSTKRPV